MIKGKTKILLTVPLILLIGITPNLAFSYFEGSPYDQLEKGVPIAEISCRDGRVLMMDLREKPGCAFEDHVEKLETFGWKKI